MVREMRTVCAHHAPSSIVGERDAHRPRTSPRRVPGSRALVRTMRDGRVMAA